MVQTLLKQGDGSIELADILAPFIVQDVAGSPDLQSERVGKFAIAVHIIAQTTELGDILRDVRSRRIDGSHGLLAVGNGLINDIERQFSLVSLMFPLLLDILYQLLTLRSAALVKARIDGVFIWIDELTHKHSEQQSLPVALRNAESAQQFWGYLPTLVKGSAYEIGPTGIIFSTRSVEIGESSIPVTGLIDGVATTGPCVSSPHSIPHPVAVKLILTAAARQFIGTVRPVPVRSLRIEMQGVGVVDVVHSLHSLLGEPRRCPPPRLQIG